MPCLSIVQEEKVSTLSEERPTKSTRTSILFFLPVSPTRLAHTMKTHGLSIGFISKVYWQTGSYRQIILPVIFFLVTIPVYRTD